jgi:hypothetical protein
MCDLHFDGLGTECSRCGSWRRGAELPDCPPYITRMEPDGERLPHIKTAEQNRLLWLTWSAEEQEQHPQPWPPAELTALLAHGESAGKTEDK